MGTREVPAPGGLGPRSQPVADATRVYGYPAARNGLALQDREETGTREGPAPWGPGPKPAGGRRHPHVRPQHSSASGQASFGTTPPPCSPKRARATDRGEAGIAEAPAPRGGAGGLQGPTPAANPPCGRWSLRQRSARADRTHVRRTARPPPPQQPGPSGSWVAEPAEVPPARQGRSQLVSVSGFPSSRASHRHRPTARTARGRSGENGTKAASRPRAMGMSEAGDRSGCGLFMSSHVQTQLTGKARLVCVCHIHNTGQGVARTCSACTNTAERQGVACVYITYTNTGQSVAGTCFHLHVRTQLRGRVWPVCGRHIRTQGRAWPVHASHVRTQPVVSV